jgi:hypothetical protein
VNCAGNKLFASSTFAADENGAIGLRNFLNGIENVLNCL